MTQTLNQEKSGCGSVYITQNKFQNKSGNMRQR